MISSANFKMIKATIIRELLKDNNFICNFNTYIQKVNTDNLILDDIFPKNIVQSVINNFNVNSNLEFFVSIAYDYMDDKLTIAPNLYLHFNSKNILNNLKPRSYKSYICLHVDQIINPITLLKFCFSINKVNTMFPKYRVVSVISLFDLNYFNMQKSFINLGIEYFNIFNTQDCINYINSNKENYYENY